MAVVQWGAVSSDGANVEVVEVAVADYSVHKAGGLEFAVVGTNQFVQVSIS